MPNFNIWIRNPYPFRWEETQAIEDALRSTYGGKPLYFKEWPVHHLSLQGVTVTTAKQVAITLKFAHRQAMSRDRRYGQAVSKDDVETEVRGRLDGRPEWAKSEERKADG